MKIKLHIGFAEAGALRIQSILADKRSQLAQKNILFPKALGPKNHVRLFMAMSDPDNVDSLRAARGFAPASRQAMLLTEVRNALEGDIKKTDAETVILSCHQLGTGLTRPNEIARLHGFLSEFSDDITVIAHIDEQAKMLVRNYSEQIMQGRLASLEREIGLAHGNWSEACQAVTWDTKCGLINHSDIQGAPAWLDYEYLVALWSKSFGAENVKLRPYDEDLFHGPDITEEIRVCFELPERIGKADPEVIAPLPSAATLTRARELNACLAKIVENGKLYIPQKLWRSLVREQAVAGDQIDAGSLAEISDYFAPMNARLVENFEDLELADLTPAAKTTPWSEADSLFGYRATQYIAAHQWRLKQASKEIEAEIAAQRERDAKVKPLSKQAEDILPDLAKEKYYGLQQSPFAPHNRIGKTDETTVLPQFSPRPARKLKGKSTGRVIVGCMKNEAPYIVEWVAYHRAIGIDNFLIYTNDCSDGTTEILDRLQEMGVLQHRNNDNWKGNSPQQHALNAALKEDVIKNCEWIIHIDVDEFINVRCGNGTMDDFLAEVPDATNVAMTWRLFGHNHVHELRDDLVIDQFDHCAPKYCPKPHITWGFKAMTKNIGAYGKISGHRPNKILINDTSGIKWVNGSGEDMTADVMRNGWRSSKSNIGYDLLQLNHYALRSAESYLIKRQRGRALHVDRTIGLNYWIRMDWNDHQDVTIQRNSDRTRAEVNRLLEDATLREWHDKGRAWHRAKADELHQNPEFHDLYEQAITLDLTALERASFALALDMES